MADSESSALAAVSKLQPSVVLVEANTPGVTVSGFVRAAKSVSPQVRCVFIVDRPEQRPAAEADGADEVLVRGFKTPHLFSVIKRLLSEHLAAQGQLCDSSV